MLQTVAKHHIIPNRDYYITIIFCHDNVNGTFQKILGVISVDKDFRASFQNLICHATVVLKRVASIHLQFIISKRDNAHKFINKHDKYD